MGVDHSHIRSQPVDAFSHATLSAKHAGAHAELCGRATGWAGRRGSSPAHLATHVQSQARASQGMQSCDSPPSPWRCGPLVGAWTAPRQRPICRDRGWSVASRAVRALVVVSSVAGMTLALVQGTPSGSVEVGREDGAAAAQLAALASPAQGSPPGMSAATHGRGRGAGQTNRRPGRGQRGTPASCAPQSERRRPAVSSRGTATPAAVGPPWPTRRTPPRHRHLRRSVGPMPADQTAAAAPAATTPSSARAPPAAANGPPLPACRGPPPPPPAAARRPVDHRRPVRVPSTVHSRCLDDRGQGRQRRVAAAAHVGAADAAAPCRATAVAARARRPPASAIVVAARRARTAKSWPRVAGPRR